MPEQTVRLGVMGGSGVYHMEGVEIVAEHRLATPFGEPSDAVVETRICDQSVYFLPRHGRGHVLLPSEVPYRANVYAMKQMGVTHLLAISAVGIMRESIKPGDMVVPDQIFDRTRGIRASTFFGEGIAGHVAFADPFCGELRDLLLAAAKKFRSDHPRRRNVYLYGGTAVLHTRRVPFLSPRSQCDRYWDDGFARSQARARG
jgi:5'-methylthioadenosine phosphorylase